MKKYLTVEDVIFIQKELIKEFGGIHGIRDQKSLDAAVMRPQTGYYKSIYDETAALIESLAMNHSFIDGNKRISFFAADVFLRMNGYFIDCDSESTYHFYIKNLESNMFRFEIIKSWLEEKIKKS
ncbi:MAG: type II toxin-antitoxin system death-on-curing family toxin [Ignavibacteriaceae bacterium]|nr:type II toxin-antitoxin system death-on-curing family toxin [Ignavibacteriaceae bacterium]